ncbi:MAG: AI-2E family transporter [Saprospiraceae bacterium]|nr:AI-2E family transporter [Saprospiraceae bacterium]
MPAKIVTDQTFLRKANRVLIFSLLLVLALYFGKSIFVPLFAALLLAFMVMGLVKKMDQWKVPTWLSALTGTLLVVFSGIGLFMFFSWQIVQFSEDMPAMEESIEKKKRSINKYIEQTYNVSRKEQNTWVNQKSQEALESAQSSIGQFFTATGAVLAALFLIPLFMFFFLLYRRKIKEFIRILQPARHEKNIEILKNVSMVGRQYLKGMGIVMVIVTVLNSTGFMILGIKYAILLGAMTAVLNIIPYVGVMIGSLLPISLALVTSDSIWVAVGAFAVCTVTQFLENNFITPKVVGSSVNVNPFASILALLVGGIIWGLPGMIMAIPVAGIAKVVFDRIKVLEPYGYMLGSEDLPNSQK